MPSGTSGLTHAIISSATLVLALAAFLLRFGSLRRWLAVALGACLLDQLAKAIVLCRLAYGDEPFRRVSLFGGRVEILYASNTELGFGGSPAHLLITSLALVGLLLVLHRRLSQRLHRMPVLTELAAALVLGGLLGILLDRVRLGGVIDFLELGRSGNYTYNLADLSALAGGLLFGARWVQLLLRRGPAPERPTPKPEWKWALLVLVASMLCLGALWHASADPDSKRPALLDAAGRGDLIQAEHLLAGGANVNERDRRGLTAVHYAAAAGQTEVVQTLLAHGARADAPAGKHNLTPLDLAIVCTNRPAAVRTARLLLEQGARPSEAALRNAAMLRNPELAKLLVAHGSDANGTRGVAIPLIGAAIVPRNTAAVKALLAAGADVNAKQQGDGQTALHKAAGHDDAEVAALLLSAGADANARDKQGTTALHAASGESPVSGKSTAKDVVAVLLSHGADPNLATNDGRTPLMRAAARGDLETARLLLRAGAHTNAKGPQGWTPLHYAAARGRLAVVRELLRAGADPEAHTDEGKTPEDVAGGAEMKALLAAGTKPSGA